jgi:hypothetical protein
MLLTSLLTHDDNGPWDREMHDAKLNKRASGYPENEKCKYCDEQATHRLLWAEAKAYIPACQKHRSKARHRIEVVNNDEVNYEREIK